MSRVLSGYGQVVDTVPERLLITASGHPREKITKIGNGTRWGPCLHGKYSEGRGRRVRASRPTLAM